MCLANGKWSGTRAACKGEHIEDKAAIQIKTFYKNLFKRLGNSNNNFNNKPMMVTYGNSKSI